MTTNSNNSLQLPQEPLSYFRRPVEVQFDKESEPVAIKHGFSMMNDSGCPIRQAFLNLANSPALECDDFDCDNECDESDPEILLTDSDDEDDFGNVDELEANTAIDSADLDNLSEGSMSDMDVFDEASIAGDCHILYMAPETKQIQNTPCKSRKFE